MRIFHEVLEKCEQTVILEVDSKPSGQKGKVWQQHSVSMLLNKIVCDSNALAKLYEDSNGVVDIEIDDLRGDDSLESFYRSLQSCREYHEKFPVLDNLSPEIELDLKLEVDACFSGEEVFGKYLDLHELFQRYCNLRFLAKESREIDYAQYLDKFGTFFYIQERHKDNYDYQSYVGSLGDYLKGFVERVHPLLDLSIEERRWKELFSMQWNNGRVQGWKKILDGNSRSNKELRLGLYDNVTELEALGMERLKEALEAVGMKCGGTLQARAARLWSIRGLNKEDIPSKLLSKVGKALLAGNEFSDPRRATAWQEFHIQKLCEMLADVVKATIRHVEKQQTRTVEEKEAEIMEEEEGAVPPDDEDDGGSDDDDAPIYNPLNLPLGWDGKPIPYWLYKLHGLNHEFKCEICGNQSYWGRRNFDRHFQEWRHNHGMKCLGVPNTREYHDITLIEDVLSLQQRLNDREKRSAFKADTRVEFEDSEGNVLNRRTYEDLARQGLL
jgi:splicing factor 3A subunit 3